VINGNVVSLVSVVGTFNTANLIYTASSNLNSSVTSISNFTQFVDKSYHKIRSFSSNIKFDRVSYTSNVQDWVSNAVITANTVVRYNGMPYIATANVYPTTTLKLNGNISANIGDYISQTGASGNAIVMANIVNSNMVTVGNLTGSYQRRGGNISVNSTITSVRPDIVTNVFEYNKYRALTADSFDNANDRIMAFYTPGNGMPARDLSKLVSGLSYPGVTIQGTGFDSITSNLITNSVRYIHSNFSLISSNISTLDFSTTEYSTGQYITLSNLDLGVADPMKFKIVNITPSTMRLLAVSGSNRDISVNSNVSIAYYDYNNPSNFDSTIQSSYLDSALGTRPEDINVDGGAYYDTYSSHAPEELVPGQTFDHFSMSVYTKILSNTQVVGYRIIGNAITNSSGTDVGLWPKYYKIANTTVLSANLNLTDTSISVVDASILPIPNISTLEPGVVYINGEQITYWRNYFYEHKTPWSQHISVDTGSLISYLGNTYITSGNVYGTTFNEISSNVHLVNVNTLAQIRRGTDRTAAANCHGAGSTVSPVGKSMVIPSSDSTSGNVHLGTWLSVNPDTAEYEFVDNLGNNLADNLGQLIVTSYNANKFLDGSGLEGSQTIQARFLRS
jgi:hypothetical protein